jgi:hypothetical protein
MKKIYLILSMSMAMVASAQNSIISNFEVFQLQVDSFLNGKEELNTPNWKGYSSGGAIFQNRFDTSFGGFWSRGFAISTMTDSITEGFTNLYSAITASGNNTSLHYAVGQQNARIYRDIDSFEAKGVYVTNTTYAALSMLNGDQFAKKFGGTTGNDPDFFLMTFVGYRNGNLTDSVKFYLADFRFTDNDSDYIVADWEWVDLSPIGMFDSIQIKLTSSDVGSFGINTPTFFAIDDFEMTRINANPVGLTKMNTRKAMDVFPNPTKDFIHITGNPSNQINIFDTSGRIILTTYETKIDVSDLQNGIYFIVATDENNSTYITRFMKK